MSKRCRVSAGVFCGHHSDHRSFKSEHFPLLGPSEREARELKQTSAGQRRGLRAVEDRRCDVGCEISEACQPLDVAVAARGGAREQSGATSMTLGNLCDEVRIRCLFGGRVPGDHQPSAMLAVRDVGADHQRNTVVVTC